MQNAHCKLNSLAKNFHINILPYWEGREICFWRFSFHTEEINKDENYDQKKMLKVKKYRDMVLTDLWKCIYPHVSLCMTLYGWYFAGQYELHLFRHTRTIFLTMNLGDHKHILKGKINEFTIYKIVLGAFDIELNPIQ